MRCVAWMLLLLAPVCGWAADWPQFRGPAADGHYTGRPLPTTWDAKTNIAWKVEIAGKGWSSPAVVGDRVYLTTAVPQGGDSSLRALCLEAKTGKSVWDVEVFLQNGRTAPKIHSKNSHASPSPIVADGKMYVHFGHQGTACLDAATGKSIWTNRDQKYAPVHGNGGSPALVDGLLVFSCDGASKPYVVALDAVTGKQRWKTARTWDYSRTFAFCTPAIIERDGKKLAVLPGSGGVAAYDVSNGDEVWKVIYEGYSVVPRPVVGKDMVYLSTSYDNAQLLAIKLGGTGDVTETHVAWRLKRGAPHNPSPLLVDDRVFLVSDQGIATCLDAQTGKTLWQERLTGKYSSSVLLADGKVFFTNEDGLTTIVRAAPKFEIVGKNNLNERTQASLAAVDGAIFFRTETHLYRIENK